MTSAVGDAALCKREPEHHPNAPWPLVYECHSRYKEGHTCPQSDGSHEHEWVAWPDFIPSVLGIVGPGIPVRCKTCGGRKCDMSHCRLRRHHVGDDHEPF